MKNNLNELNENDIKRLAVIMAYLSKGIKGYYDLVEETDDVKEKIKKNIEQYGERKAIELHCFSKIDVINEFLMLKQLTDDDAKILVNELEIEVKKLKELYKED